MSTSSPRIALIAAVAANQTIGKQGHLPWHLPQDLRYFKSKTSGSRIIMGRRTWESFPKPLPEREHVVISSRQLQLPERVVHVQSMSEALALPLLAGLQSTEVVFVIGGFQAYREALPKCTDLFLTEIQAEVEGDTVFPDWDRQAFEEVSRESHQAPLIPEGPDVPFDFVHYRRVSSTC